MNLLILAANSQIARILEKRLLTEPQYGHVNLTLFLRRSERLSHLADNPRVTIIEGDIENFDIVNQAMVGQDIVYVANVDIQSENKITQSVVNAMRNQHVARLISSNAIGIYNEVPGEFGRQNMAAIDYVLPQLLNSEKLVVESGLNYTILRLPWLNNDNDINYMISTRHELFEGDYVSRPSVADLVLKMIDDPKYGVNESFALENPY